MIRQNRAIPILMVLTVAFILFAAGCFEAEGTTVESREAADEPEVNAPPPAPPVVVSATPTAGSAPNEEAFYHTVESGDLLSTIATKYDVDVNVILRANPDIDGGNIFPGQELLIPGATMFDGSEPTDPSDREPGETTSYLIEPGDTLGVLADEYEVSVDSIYELNELGPNAVLSVGQEILIPPVGTGLPPEELESADEREIPTREPGQPQRYVVQPGDLLVDLAELFSVTPEAIMAANNIEDGNQLFVGQELTIPPPTE